ncbi:APK1 [Auxenochlorella protothecoides x Auxenochlorella symbiontica]
MPAHVKPVAGPHVDARRPPMRGQVRPQAVAAPPLRTRDVGRSTNVRWHQATVQRADKERMLCQRGCVLWFTGLSASGKSTVAATLESILHQNGHYTMLLDGDNVRHGLNSNLGFSAEDRAENIRRVGEVAKLAAESGILTITSFISPYRADRDAVRARMAPGDFLEIYLRVPLALCEQRDPKGLYKKARAGKISNFTGINDPYEEPTGAEIVLDPYDEEHRMYSPEELALRIFDHLTIQQYLLPVPSTASF